MHKGFHIALAAVLAVGMTAEISAKKVKEYVETPASDTRIEYTGRTLTEGTDVS